MNVVEKRVHPRIQISAEVRVSGPRGVDTGTMRNFSKGGAAILLSTLAGSVGDELEVFLPFAGGLEIVVVAEIVRLEETPTGILHSVRYCLVEPAMQEKLSELIEGLISSRSDPNRAHPRIARRLPIRYGKLSELRAILENISMGGLAMVTGAPLVLYEEIDLLIPIPGGKDSLTVKGRVVHQQHVRENDHDQFRIGLAFKDLSPALERCLKELIHYILELKSDSLGGIP